MVLFGEFISEYRHKEQLLFLEFLVTTIQGISARSTPALCSGSKYPWVQICLWGNIDVNDYM